MNVTQVQRMDFKNSVWIKYQHEFLKHPSDGLQVRVLPEEPLIEKRPFHH